MTAALSVPGGPMLWAGVWVLGLVAMIGILVWCAYRPVTDGDRRRTERHDSLDFPTHVGWPAQEHQDRVARARRRIERADRRTAVEAAHADERIARSRLYDPAVRHVENVCPRRGRA